MNNEVKKESPKELEIAYMEIDGKEGYTLSAADLEGKSSVKVDIKVNLKKDEV